MKALIVGGGVAGLALSAFLRRNGHSVNIIEKARDWKTIGYVLGIFPNGMDVLRRLGIADELLANAAHLRAHVLKDAEGHELARTDLERFSHARTRVVELERDEVHRLLRKINADTSVRLGTTVESLLENDGGIDVRFSDGRSATYDMIAGCDGVHSQMRSYVQTEPVRDETGISFWLAWIKNPPALPRDVVYYLGNGKAAAIFPSSHGRFAAAFLLPTRMIEEGVHDNAHFLRSHFADLGDVIPTLLAHLPPSAEIFQSALREGSLPLWHRGRIVLLGDAVHALSPVLGMGASMALEDAQVLSQELEASKDDLPQAFLRYQRRRQPRTRKLHRWSKTMHRLLCLGGPLTSPRDVLVSKVITPSYFHSLNRLLSRPA